MEELNGFKIETYNQYNFPENAKTHTCPECSHTRKKKTDKCLKIYWDTGLAECFHCGELLQLHTFAKNDVKKQYVKPEWKNNTELSEKLVKWFEGRKISQFTLRRMKIAEGMEWMPQTKSEVNTLQFPYFRDGELVNIKYRCSLPEGKKGFKLVKDAEKIPYNIDNIRTSKEAIIVEGEPDVLSYVECGILNVVSVPNGSTLKTPNLEWLDNSYEYFENKDKIIIAVDSDEAGQVTQKELIRRLGAEKCYIADYKDCKDANEYLIKYGKDELRETLTEAKQVPLEYVETLADFEHEFDDFFINGLQPGYQIGLPSFDKIFSTELGQYFVVTGIPSSGKSEWVDQMCIGYNLNYDWKIGYASPENKPNKLHAAKIARKLAGYTPEASEKGISELRWTVVKDHIKENFFFIEKNTYDLKSILAKGAELVKRKGIKVLVIDPYNKVRMKESDQNNVNIYTNDYLNEIDLFCRKYQVLVILVAHPVKMQRINGIYQEPDFYSIKGGGEFYDMSYHGLLVHRDYSKELVKVKVLKVKFDHLGENQAETWFKWNPSNTRYNEIIGDVEEEMSSIEIQWDNENYIAKSLKEHKQDEFDWNTVESNFNETTPF